MQIGRIIGAALLGIAGLASVGTAQERAGEFDRRWLDSTVTTAERDRLSTMIGLAPPEFPGSMRWIGDGASLDEALGKVVVVQFWSRGDRRGALRLDQLAALQKKVGDDLVVVGVHVAHLSEGVEGFLGRRGVGVPVGVDTDGSYAAALGATSTLANVVIDRAGEVRHVLLNPAGIEGVVGMLVAEPAPAPRPADEEGDVNEQETADGKKRRPSVTPPSGRAPTAGRRPEGFSETRLPDELFPPATGDVGGATDLRGQEGPPIVVDEWLTDPPDAGGKVVIVDLWATWCGPCIQMIPHMNRIQGNYRDSVTVIGVTDEPSDKVRSWLPGKGIRYAIGVDPSRRIAGKVRNSSIPYAVVYSPDGVIRWQGHPARLTEETLDAIVEASRVTKR